MGGGRYSYEEHEALTRARAGLSKEQVFAQGSCHPDMNPRGVAFRESRDSEAHPASRGIVFAFDVSGSMGEIPVELAQKTLPTFMKSVLTVLPDPQLLFMAVGNAYESKSPLQVGQFESEDALIDRWLRDIHLEGGGEWRGESYDLAMYFAAHHTVLDCFAKRRKKGYFFMTGDEVYYLTMQVAKANEVLGIEAVNDAPIEVIVDELARTYHPFFLIPDPARAKHDDVLTHWRRLLGDAVIVLETPEDAALAAAMLIGIREGQLPDAAAITAKLTGELDLPPLTAARVVRAVEPYAQAVARGGGDPPTTRPPVTGIASVRMPG
ncbi:MAG: VWA domain-containing protein [Deltaproteobacteria bacterium]|nr:VWA domain-containing protein [Deltaproteobacteria bacterium]